MPALDNAKHEAYCRAYTQGPTAGNAAASYALAYGKDAKANASRSAASRLNHDVSVCKRVAELQQQNATIETKATEQAIEKAALTKQWIIERLMENAARAMQAEAVLDAEGEPTGEYKYDGSVANKAYELLGKHLGMFVDRVAVTDARYAISDEPASAEEWAKEYPGPGPAPAATAH